MAKSSPAVKGGVLGAALLIALVAGYLVLVAPKRHEAAQLSKEIGDTRAQIAAAQAGSGPQQPQAQPIRVADLFKLSRAMPDTADIPTVLLQLSAISAETGVTFQSITPHDPVSRGAYQQIGIDLVFEGHFYDLSDFLYRLRNLVGVHQGVLDATGRLFSVDAIQFDEGQLQFPQVKATLTVSAYVYGDGTSDPLPAGATGSGEAAPSAGTTTPAPAAAPAASEGDSQPIPAAPAGATAAGA
jgi:hypothetical protein